nr:four-carbon acid sugar kinase family protein [Notoacmeibacter sp. MSK16QG-6]
MKRDRVFIVADDLTGALDSAATFAEHGARVRVACTPDNLTEALASPADVVAVATGTRELSESDARDVVTSVARHLAEHKGLLFKKVDSRLKGNIAAEIDALIPSEKTLFFNPAVPKLDRYCMDGAVVGSGIDAPIPVAGRLGRSIKICDARTQQDLIEQLPNALGESAFAGAAGLAEALACRLWPEGIKIRQTRPTLPAMMAVGSRDPVTGGQIEALGNVPIVTAPNGFCRQFPQVPLLLIRMTRGAEEISPGTASDEFAKTLEHAYRFLSPTTIFACGGESAGALLQRLGVGQLDVDGEVMPGMPVARCIGQVHLSLITKSGGFGQPDALVKLVKLLNLQ